MQELKQDYHISLLTANTNQELLGQQILQFSPDVAAIGSEPKQELIDICKQTNTHLVVGCQQIPELIEQLMPDLVLNALVGFSGFLPSAKTLELGIDLALANKESLVVGGKLMNQLATTSKAKIIPVDSEHSAMLQCLVGEQMDSLRRIIITASGGAFRQWSLEKLKTATAAEALQHPNWDMGAKVTVDSATMMNKGLEVIEAYWLFDLPLENIVPVIHPQSIIHSMVEFKDGSTKAQLGPPDMRVPISYALAYPERSNFFTPVLDWTQAQEMTFEPMDYERFKCLKLAQDALDAGGLATSVLNAANEWAVNAFLKNRISFLEIANTIELALEKINFNHHLSLDNIKAVDHQTHTFLNKSMKI
jgi:1-deoxy-D-xylulose-5-phosphate reductoisomerase